MNERVFLIIDDDAAIRGFTERCLKHFGPAKVHMAADGQTGMNMARELKPDLIILDIRMPAANGLSVLRLLKTDESTAAIPVVVATGEVDFRLGADAGHEALLWKPYTQRQFVQLVKPILDRQPTTEVRSNAAAAA